MLNQKSDILALVVWFTISYWPRTLKISISFYCVFTFRILNQAMASANPDVVVWQWRGDDNVWHCYDPHISNYIENSRKQQHFQVNLQSVDKSLPPYIVDLAQHLQIRQDTGISFVFFGFY